MAVSVSFFFIYCQFLRITVAVNVAASVGLCLKLCRRYKTKQGNLERIRAMMRGENPYAPKYWVDNGEGWRTHPDFPVEYSVSDRGRVMNRHEKILKGSLDNRGYMRVSLHSGGVKFDRTVHRLVMEAFVGFRGEGMTVNHKNGIKTDNRLSNLEYCTLADNIRHGHKMGLYANCGRKPKCAVK